MASQRDRDRRVLAQFAVVVLTLLALAAMWPVVSMSSESRTPLSVVVVVALAWSGLAFAWQALRGPGVGAAIAGVAGAALLGKVWFAPITLYEMDGPYVLSPTSETHLYFVLPGLGLLAVAAAIKAGLRVWAPTSVASEAKLGGEVERIELPRPRPPEPPG